MNRAKEADSIDRLLTALEYGTKKEDREFVDKLLDSFSLKRQTKAKLIEGILAAPGFEPFFIATMRESRPFALMLKETYALLSRVSATAERRASLFRVSGAEAREAFDFDLEAFPKEVLRVIGEFESAIDILRPEFGNAQEANKKFVWRNSDTEKLWRAVDPVWDGDFYDDGFLAALSYAGTVLKNARPEERAHVETLVTPIIDRLRALTATLQWKELGVSQKTIENVSQSYMNGVAETLRIAIYPVTRSRLDQDTAMPYFLHALSEDRSGAPSLSGPVEEDVWDLVKRKICGYTIAIHHWLKKIERKDPRSWLENRTSKKLASVTPDDYIRVLEPLANAFSANLNALLPTADQEITTQQGEALIEFFNLPFWKDRWFLYELWTLCRVLTLAGSRWPFALQGIEQREDGVVEWKLPGGLASAPVAKIGAMGEIECWTQRKTIHPVSGEGLEPDLRITRSTAGHPDIVVIENKDRRRPRTSEIAEILTRYSTGTEARCVFLINYETFTGPTHDLPRSVPGKELFVFSKFRPSSEPAEFSFRLLQILEDELPTAKVADKPKQESARAEFLTVTLRWENPPLDLDLHAWIDRGSGAQHVSYTNFGSLDSEPQACLSNDATAAPGEETIKLRTEGLERATFAVHRFSVGSMAASLASVEIDGVSDEPQRFTPRDAGTSAWWHVAEIGSDLSVKTLNVFADKPPR